MSSSINKNQLLNNLRVFIDEQKTWLRNTLDSVGWDISHLENSIQTEEPHFIPCSINPEHRIPRENLLDHETRCERKNAEYPVIDDPSNLEVTLDLKDAIRSVSDCNDGSSDNLDANTTAKNKSEDKGNSSTCLIELLAAERDAKRRRAAHRGKRVHSNKKSYVEVLREVITSQMETLNDDSKSEIESETIEPDPSQKTIIQPRVDSYLGVGSKIYSGNPFKRWMTIEEEERELIKEIQSDNKKEKYSEYDRRREDTYEKYKKYEKSTYDDDDTRKRYHHQHREYYDDRHRDISKSSNDRHSYRNDRKALYSSYYDDEKNSRRKPERDRTEKRHRDDSYSDSYEASDRHKKKRKKKSRDRTDDSYDSSDRHHKKKRKKKSHERSVHKKKHSKSKHRDSDDEQNRAKS